MIEVVPTRSLRPVAVKLVLEREKSMPLELSDSTSNGAVTERHLGRQTSYRHETRERDVGLGRQVEQHQLG